MPSWAADQLLLCPRTYGYSTKDGGRYEGEWRNHVKHGMGKMFYGSSSDELSYNGSWADGMRSGLGILVLANGDRFEGHWRDDAKEGPGRYFYRATNKVYEGEWVNNIPKCGSYSSAPAGSFPEADGGDGDVAAAAPAGFVLPTLRLLGPDTVAAEAVAGVRQARAESVRAQASAASFPGPLYCDRGTSPLTLLCCAPPHSQQTGELRAFAPSEMEVLRRSFAVFDTDDSGFVRCGDLHALVTDAGVDVPASFVDAVVASLEADSAAALTFAEVVDIVALLAAS